MGLLPFGVELEHPARLLEVQGFAIDDELVVAGVGGYGVGVVDRVAVRTELLEDEFDVCHGVTLQERGGGGRGCG